MANKLKKKGNKKQIKKEITEQKKRQQLKKRNYRREEVVRYQRMMEIITNWKKALICLFKEESDATNESESDNNDIEKQISEDMQISIESTKPTRNRQLPIRYRQLN